MARGYNEDGFDTKFTTLKQEIKRKKWGQAPFFTDNPIETVIPWGK